MENQQPLQNSQNNNNQGPPGSAPSLGAAAPAQGQPQRVPVYPEATHGVLSSTPVPGQPINTMPSNLEKAKTKAIVIAVVVFGSFIVAVSAYSLFVWIMLVRLSDVMSPSNLMNIALSAATLMLGIGIIKRREIARFIYVVVATIMLVLSLYGTYSYINYMRKFNQPQASTNSIANMERSITQYQNSDNLTADQKDQIIKPLQAAIELRKQQEAQRGSKNVQMLIGTVMGYVLALVPIVFLTRPRVKVVFD